MVLQKGEGVSVMKWLLRMLPAAAILLFSACNETGSGKTELVATGGGVSEDISRTYLYDDLGRLVKEDLGDGRYIAYTYDKSGSLVKQALVDRVEGEAKQ